MDRGRQSPLGTHNMLVTADEGFFTDHAQDNKFLLHKQASKLDYYRKENDQLKERINNLNTNLHLNKQLLAMTEDTHSASMINVDKDSPAKGQHESGRMSADPGSNQAKLRAYQDREEAM